MKNVLCVMNRTGDTRLMWNPNVHDEVAAAKKMFDDLKAKGYLAYSVEGEKGDKGSVINKFDPKISKIIMSPPMQGG